MSLHSGVVFSGFSESYLPSECVTDAYVDRHGCCSRVNPREGSCCMLAVCRGRISAIILCACAAIMGAKVSAQNTSTSQTVTTVGEDLLRHSENPRSLDVHSRDI